MASDKKIINSCMETFKIKGVCIQWTGLLDGGMVEYQNREQSCRSCDILNIDYNLLIIKSMQPNHRYILKMDKKLLCSGYNFEGNNKKVDHMLAW